MRKEVEISAYVAGAGEAFIHGSHDTGRISSSFDEPLSSAMASGLEYPSSPPVIPMFPNGTPGSFKNSIPIQRVAAGLSDGMTEGFARVRREIGRVRSPRLVAHHDVTVGVPLEFGEDDEEFLRVTTAGPCLRRHHRRVILGSGRTARIRGWVGGRSRKGKMWGNSSKRFLLWVLWTKNRR